MDNVMWMPKKKCARETKMMCYNQLLASFTVSIIEKKMKVKIIM